MEDTKRLFFDDPYQTEFKARIVLRDDFKGRPAVVLDQTCFYPESGGQPADQGYLNDIAVLDVQEQNSRIWHVLAEYPVAQEVTGCIDWTTRFDHMQQHAGQHILSQCFFELLHGETQSFHLGLEVSTLEIGIQNITEAETEKIEYRANQIVYENKKIKSYFVGEKNIDQVPLRRPPKKSGRIRVIEVDGFDYSACGGTHPDKTGEIGIVKILKWERIRNNIRFEFVCGHRARRDYSKKNQLLLTVATRFSAAEHEIPELLEKLFTDLKEQKKRNKKIKSNLAAYEAKDLLAEIDGRIIKKIYMKREPEEVRNLALNIIRDPGYVVILGLKTADRAHVVMARSEDQKADMRDLVPIVAPLINGKGGGRPSLVEVAGDKPVGLDQALESAYSTVKKDHS